MTATAGTSRTSATSAVLDASTLVRAYAYGDPAANGWLDQIAAGALRAAWPSHVYVEVANAVLVLVRARRIGRDLAEATVAETLAIPARISPTAEILPAALALASERGLTVYDAAYVVLAEALGVPLVTADRRVSEATEQGVLLAG